LIGWSEYGRALSRRCLRQLLPKDICSALLEYAARKDNRLRRAGEQDHINHKTVCIIK
jgi:hypothetical protein